MKIMPLVVSCCNLQ